MKLYIRYLFFLASIFGTMIGYAQVGQACIDSNRVNAYFHCSSNEFRPVCGCDGITYTNGCDAYNRNGVNTIVYNGVCEADVFFFEIRPIPVYEKIDFYVQVAPDENPRATVQIFDIFGNLVYFKLLTNVPDEFEYRETIYFSGKTGVYTMVVNVGGTYKVKKFIKLTHG